MKQYLSRLPVPLGSLEEEQDLQIVAALGNLFFSLEEVTHYDWTLSMGSNSLLGPAFDIYNAFQFQCTVLLVHRSDLLHFKIGSRDLR